MTNRRLDLWRGTGPSSLLINWLANNTVDRLEVNEDLVMMWH